MMTLENTELLHEIVQEIADTAPNDWKKILFYQEMEKSDDGSIRNKSTGQCWHGSAMEKYSRGFEIGTSIEAFEAIENLFEQSIKESKPWKGVLVTIFENGKYNFEFFYENSPLLDGNDEELTKILNND